MQRFSGMSLVELLITMLLSLLLLGFILNIFLAMTTSSRQVRQLAQLQQNGQFLISLFHNELQNMGFWAGHTLADMNTIVDANPAVPDGDCVSAETDSGSFPRPEKLFIPVFAKTVSSGRQLNCIPNAIAGTELLQLKRAIGLKTASTELRQNRFYLESDWPKLRFVSQASTALQQNADYYPYQHVVFYLQQQTVDGNNVPVLMRKRLIRAASGEASISTDSVLDGVERLHFEFGIDSDGDGQLNYYLPTNVMTTEQWQQQTLNIISVTFYLLLRSNDEDRRYRNTQQYSLGHVTFIAPGDHYRRLQLSSTVFFQNVVLSGG